MSTRRATSSGSSRSQRPCSTMNDSTIRASHSAASTGSTSGRRRGSAATCSTRASRSTATTSGAGLLELRQQPAGLGGEQALEHLVLRDGAVGEREAADQPGAQVRRVVDGAGQAAEEATDLPRHRLVDELLPAAGEPAVDAGPADAGLPGHLVDGDPPQPDPPGDGDDRAEHPVAGVIASRSGARRRSRSG